VHGEDIAALFDIFVGRALVVYNPKLRLERQIYRGIREAVTPQKPRAPEQAKKVSDLRETLPQRGLYIGIECHRGRSPKRTAEIQIR